MELKIKYYLHIQQIKKLKSEIDIINKHKYEYKIQKISIICNKLPIGKIL